MSRFEKEGSRELFASGARFIANTIKYPPEDFISFINEIRSSTASSESTAFLAMVVAEYLFEQKNSELPQSDSVIFFAAVSDTKNFVEFIAQKYPDMSDDEVSAICSDQSTVHTIALLALRPGFKSRDYIKDKLPKTGKLLANNTSFVIDDTDLQVEADGCPAAGSISIGIDPLPIFSQIIPWATKLTILSDEWKVLRDHKYEFAVEH